MAVTPGLVQRDKQNRLPHPDLDATKEASLLPPTQEAARLKQNATPDDLRRMVVLSNFLTDALKAANDASFDDRLVHLYAAENYVDALRERIRLFS